MIILRKDVYILCFLIYIANPMVDAMRIGRKHLEASDR